MKTATAALPYTLYGTSACHLCELAEELLVALGRENPGMAFEKVDISGSDALIERYGLRIPVLRDAGGRELDWPFTAGQLREFIDQ